MVKDLSLIVLSCKSKYFEDVEHIIIDGGSEDNTASLIQEYSRKYKYKLPFRKEYGIYKGINIGLKIAQMR